MACSVPSLIGTAIKSALTHPLRAPRSPGGKASAGSKDFPVTETFFDAEDDGIPDGFEAVTQSGITVTSDGEPVYVAE